MGDKEPIVFTATQMSDPNHASRALVIANTIIDDAHGQVITDGSITIVPTENGGVISMVRPAVKGGVPEHVDIQVSGVSVRGEVHSKYADVTGPDELSAKSTARHLAGIAMDLGIPVIFPEHHTMAPLR